MTLHWTSDPAKLIEREDNQRSCDGCNHNLFERQPNNFKKWYCELGFDQKGGTALRSHCKNLRGD